MSGAQIASPGIIFTPSLIQISQLVQTLDGYSHTQTHTQHSDLKCTIFFSAVHVHVFVPRHITPMAMCASPNFRDKATTPDEVTDCRILKCVTVLFIPHNPATTRCTDNQ
jgi:hypothetical protein